MVRGGSLSAVVRSIDGMQQQPDAAHGVYHGQPQRPEASRFIGFAGKRIGSPDVCRDTACTDNRPAGGPLVQGAEAPHRRRAERSESPPRKSHASTGDADYGRPQNSRHTARRAKLNEFFCALAARGVRRVSCSFETGFVTRAENAVWLQP